MSLFGIGAGVVASVLGDVIGGAMQSHSASKQAELEAKLQRENWEYAQKNAHQFEVQDLKSAGLNPILSANHSQLASMPSVSIPQGPSAYGNLGSNLNSAIGNAMRNEIESGRLDNEKTRLEIEKDRLELDKKKNASDLQVNEAVIDKMDNDIKIAWEQLHINERLASANIQEKEAASFELYAKAKEALAHADLYGIEKEKLDITMKYGSILAGYLPAEVRKLIGENLVTYCQGHQDTINSCVEQLFEIATSKTSSSEKESDVKQTLYDFFGVQVTYDPSLLTNLIKVRKK